MKVDIKLPLVLLACGVIALDQVSKNHFIELLGSGADKELVILPFLKMVYSWNKGVAFGIFATAQNSNSIFLITSLCIIGFLMFLLTRADKKLETLSYTLIISGAVGNILDRIRYGKVFDFICLHVGSYSWPAFNVADAAISCGCLVFVLGLIYRK
jgi:signal peptidase II